MTRRTHADERDRDTEPKFYLPAGITPPSEAGLLEYVRTRLFSHRI
ncbi:hypothetical protein [Haloplanus salilacus]